MSEPIRWHLDLASLGKREVEAAESRVLKPLRARWALALTETWERFALGRGSKLRPRKPATATVQEGGVLCQ